MRPPFCQDDLGWMIFGMKGGFLHSFKEYEAFNHHICISVLVEIYSIKCVFCSREPTAVEIWTKCLFSLQCDSCQESPASVFAQPQVKQWQLPYLTPYVSSVPANVWLVGCFILFYLFFSSLYFFSSLPNAVDTCLFMLPQDGTCHRSMKTA